MGGDLKWRTPRIAEVAGFELIVTTYKNVHYQQNFIGRKISIVVLGNSPWWLARKYLDAIVTPCCRTSYIEDVLSRLSAS